jgi:dTDP-4-amino-4,6-dideoxygalactose transaminase
MMQNLRVNNILASYNKKTISDLALFGGNPVFEEIKSTANLVRPDEKNFFNYAKTIFETRRISNNGSLVHQLEKRLAELHQVKHCVTACNGLWALILTLKAIMLSGKTEVIMPSLTYRRLAFVAAWVNLTPHFCDVDFKTMAMSPEFVEPCINENTAAILAAHAIITPCDINGLTKLAEKYKIPIMFDSVEAVYATNDSIPIGSFGEAEIFSIHSSKLINGFEGGYITTNNDILAEKLRVMRGFGFSFVDHVSTLGVNAKLNEIHAAMALASLDDLEDQVKRNKKRYYKYKEELQKIDSLQLIEYDEVERRGFKNIIVKLNEKWPISRDETIKLMHAEKMLVRPYYSPPLHLKKAGYQTIIGDMTNTMKLKDNHMLMPCGEFVDESDIEKIILFLKFIENNANEIKTNYAYER